LRTRFATAIVRSCLAAGAASLLVPAAFAQPLCTSAPYLAYLAGATTTRQVDLLAVGRVVAKERGLVQARETLETFMTLQDASRGDFERELVRATVDADYRVPGALDTLPRAGDLDGVSRRDILFLFINGLGQTTQSVSTKALAEALLYLRSEGFEAQVLGTSPYASTEANAAGLLAQLQETLGASSTRYVVVVAASKGVHDFVEALATSERHDGRGLTAEEVGKIRFVISMSGIVRNSVVAGWLVDSNRLVPRLVRIAMQEPIGRFPHLDGIKSIRRDPWQRFVPTGGTRRLDFVWVSFAVFPDGANGRARTGFVRSRLLRSLQGSSAVGPNDGLTESASSILPPGTGLEQWIVRVRGAHGLVKGRYVDGTPLVTAGRGGLAVQIVDPLLRTLPISRLAARQAP